MARYDETGCTAAMQKSVERSECRSSTQRPLANLFASSFPMCRPAALVFGASPNINMSTCQSSRRSNKDLSPSTHKLLRIHTKFQLVFLIDPRVACAQGGTMTCSLITTRSDTFSALALPSLQQTRQSSHHRQPHSHPDSPQILPRPVVAIAKPKPPPALMLLLLCRMFLSRQGR